jgi:hypothetical protein
VTIGVPIAVPGWWALVHVGMPLHRVVLGEPLHSIDLTSRESTPVEDVAMLRTDRT